MLRWKWFQRRDKAIDVSRPATAYGGHPGAYTSGAAPSEQRNWNMPTEVHGLPLLTYGQQTQYGVNGRKRGERA